MTLAKAIQQGLYFCSDSGTYSHVAFCLASGLNQLGVPIYSNIQCCHPTTSFSFEAQPDSSLLKNSLCAVLDVHGACDQFPYTVKRVSPIHERTVALCMHDNVANFVLEGDIPFFCTHENKFRRLSGIRIPIGFGISEKLAEHTCTVPSFGCRNRFALDSFHPSLKQDVRACLELLLLPQLQQQLPVKKCYTDTQNEFWSLLKQTGFCLGYGGMFEQDLSATPYFMSIEMVRDFWSHITFHRPTVVTRWDSWRFWESLVCGSVTIHLDFDRYGFLLPIMPENWKHYIGIDLVNIKKDVERIMDEWDRMEEIAWNGRLWALEHYSPVAVAKRFLKTLQALEYSADAR